MLLMVTDKWATSKGRRTLSGATASRPMTVDLRPLWPTRRSVDHGVVWIDDRGSEVLALPECRRLLAVAAKEHRHGHLGVPQEGAPLVLPVDYAVHESDVVLRIGEGLFHQVGARLVAFQVDGVTDSGGVDGDQSRQIWSVLVQGLAIEDSENVPMSHVPQPEVIDPGRRIVRIRTDVISGRRFPIAPTGQ